MAEPWKDPPMTEQERRDKDFVAASARNVSPMIDAIKRAAVCAEVLVRQRTMHGAQTWGFKVDGHDPEDVIDMLADWAKSIEEASE